MAKRDVIELLRNYIYVLRSEGITVNSAYLFGSYLTNSATNESDIDVMVVSDFEDDYLAGKLWSLTKRVSTKIEPYLVGSERFSNSNSPLIEMVKSKGLLIT